MTSRRTLRILLIAVASSLVLLLAGAGTAQHDARPTQHDPHAAWRPARPAQLDRAAPAYAAAIRIAKLGPRPAASAAERRAHELAGRAFRRAGLRVSVKRFHIRGRGGSRNVIGAFDTKARCLRVVMAHADTTPAGPGANDNASGVGVLMALARRIPAARPRCDTWLVATGAEERVYTGSPDHLGALALARQLRRSGRAKGLRFGLSLDEVGRGRSFWIRSPVRAPRRGLERRVIASGRRFKTPIAWVRDEGSGNSDHRELELLGMPSAKLGVGRAGEPCRHMACDRPGRLSRTSLRLITDVVLRVLRD